jgi:hypothetical protein
MIFIVIFGSFAAGMLAGYQIDTERATLKVFNMMKKDPVLSKRLNQLFEEAKRKDGKL